MNRMSTVVPTVVRTVALLGLAIAMRESLPGEGLTSRQAADRIGYLLAKEMSAVATPSDSAALPAIAAAGDDATFLRRVTLDLVGQPPTPQEITKFALDTSADKRKILVDRLLDDSRFGTNWGRYWRDVMLARRTDERALLTSSAGLDYLTQAFNEGMPWNQIARELITAEGNLASEGRTILLASQWGETPDTAAEVSRVLLGVQIQCAQCHDHPTDRWKRQQFHELAAYFPRAVVRPARKDTQRIGFEVISVDFQRRRALANEERPRRIEYYMPDLQDPSAQGELLQPKFFLTGSTVPIGTDDAGRRNALADQVTSPENPWFSKAFVNRIWGELLAEGFYEPVDDLGPDRQCSAPLTLDLLARQFVASRYNVKWLMRTIVLTDAYQRESRPRRGPTGTAFVANCWQPLRGDQLFDAVTLALGFEEPATPGPGRNPPRPGLERRTPRGMFNEAFGFDPSDPREEIAQSIPQALILMNAPPIQQAINARDGKTSLSSLLQETTDDAAVVSELYLRTLAREPSSEESQKCQDYIAKVGNRTEAFEDLQWVLLNSTEFLFRQ